MNRTEICGNIASGKTTLCKNLLNKGFIPVLENFHDNPFLKKFYQDPLKFSFETEITFLLLHYNSIKVHIDNNLTAFDFSLFQDIAYADVNLEGNRHKLFLDITKELQREILFPSKLIHITCPANILLERIKRRDRKVEVAITIDYLKEVNKAITYRVNEAKKQIPIISVDSHVVNFTKELIGLQKAAPPISESFYNR